MPRAIMSPVAVVATAFESIYVLNAQKTLHYNSSKDEWIQCAWVEPRQYISAALV